MRLLLIFLSVFSFNTALFAQTETGETRIFIVRHAEKEAGKDPLLTPAGNKRAGDLLQVLRSENIQKIYVSQFRRTQQTADSLRIQLGIDTVHYTADTLCDKLVGAIMAHSDFGKTILVVAHSNTIPQLIRKLGVFDYPYGDIADPDYENLFLVRYEKGKAKLTQMRFGEPSAGSAPMH